ncbi:MULTISPECIES: hypothetical protein [Paenibacillus]|uniref:hypothetical protein n=1 Tax=Paenibacillus TaxID=44249 RepID=UPI0022B88889|nr:hypothetical protein [Paenibacillus caseinilyticus]MCZ8521458.1 hypothetical protein [Paenibacillus caseinilyticus]
MTRTPTYRRYRALLSPFNTSQMHRKNPWIPAFFSFSFPGFGHLLQHRYAKAFTLISWEIFINSRAQINTGIMYSLQGQFGRAKEILNPNWLMIYVAIYMFGIWDSYRSAVEMNNLYTLADREDAPIQPIAMSTWDLNYLNKRVPWVASAWSLLAPGLGHLYLHKVLPGFFLFGWTIAIMYFSHIPMAMLHTAAGEFQRAKEVLNMQWTLYLPSIYCFVFYDSYVSAVEYNKLFEKEMSRHLRTNYQDTRFPMPRLQEG